MRNPATTTTSKQNRVWESEGVWECKRRSWRVGGCEERLPRMGVVISKYMLELFFVPDFTRNFQSCCCKDSQYHPLELSCLHMLFEQCICKQGTLVEDSTIHHCTSWSTHPQMLRLQIVGYFSIQVEPPPPSCFSNALHLLNCSCSLYHTHATG